MAIAKVFALPELLEQILLATDDMKTLLFSRRVSRLWNTAIGDSVKLQEALFFRQSTRATDGADIKYNRLLLVDLVGGGVLYDMPHHRNSRVLPRQASRMHLTSHPIPQFEVYIEMDVMFQLYGLRKVDTAATLAHLQLNHYSNRELKVESYRIPTDDERSLQSKNGRKKVCTMTSGGSPGLRLISQSRLDPPADRTVIRQTGVVEDYTADEQGRIVFRSGRLRVVK